MAKFNSGLPVPDPTEAILTAFVAGIEAFRSGDLKALDEAFAAFQHLSHRYTKRSRQNGLKLNSALDRMYRRIDVESEAGFTPLPVQRTQQMEIVPEVELTDKQLQILTAVQDFSQGDNLPKMVDIIKKAGISENKTRALCSVMRSSGYLRMKANKWTLTHKGERVLEHTQAKAA